MKYIAFAIPVMMLALCAGAADAADKVKLSRSTPYANEGGVPAAVKNECQLTTEIASYVGEFAGDSVELVDGEAKGGKVLQLKIAQVFAPGGGIFSGPKSVLVEGELSDNGKVVGTLRARRNSTRGAGTCQILSASARAVGKDIAAWLADPAMDARLGDAR